MSIGKPHITAFTDSNNPCIKLNLSFDKLKNSFYNV
jgi:hypothetical protein